MQNIFYLMLKTTESNSNLGHPLPYFSLELKCVVLNRQIIGKIKIKIQICNYVYQLLFNQENVVTVQIIAVAKEGKNQKELFGTIVILQVK